MNNNEIQKAHDYIKMNEGYSAVPYIDTVGKVTVGYGHNINSSPMTPSMFMQYSKALQDQNESRVKTILDDLFIMDYEEVEKMLQKRVEGFGGMDFKYKIVLLDMGFNLGYRLFTFKRMLGSIRKGNAITASIELMDSKYAKQTDRRADRNAKWLREGRGD